MAETAKKDDGRKPEKAAKTGSVSMKLLKYPYLTEKSMTLVERANTITFIVDTGADKRHIKDEFEAVFGVKVAKVNVLVTPDGKKKAFVKLTPAFKAGDVATKLGVV